MSNPFDTPEKSPRDDNARFLKFQEPFNPEHYIEKLARPNKDNVILGQDGSDFDPRPLRDVLKKDLSELQIHFDNKLKQVKRVEDLNIKRQLEFKRKTKEHDQSLHIVDSQYQDLDKIINFVSTKVVHLGDQLKQMDEKRKRASEAKVLMDYINEARNTGKISSSVFTNESEIHEAARLVHRITLAAQDLPKEKFHPLHEVLQEITQDIETKLKRKFEISLQHYDIVEHQNNMKICANTLNQPCFHAYKDVVDSFIDARLRTPFRSKDFFKSIKDVIDETSEITSGVFTDHDNIMSKFIRCMYDGKIKKYVDMNLHFDSLTSNENRTASDLDEYLSTLNELYSKTLQLSTDLSKYDNDIMLGAKLTKSIFQQFLDSYAKIEIDYLTQVSSDILNQFYMTMNHEKKTNPDKLQSHIMDLKTKLKNLSDNMSNSMTNLSNQPYDMPTDQLLSVNVTTSLLNVHGKAVERCKLLCEGNSSDIISKIVQCLLESYVINHLEYAIDCCANNRLPLEPKTEPVVQSFLMIVGNANIIFHNLERFFNDKVMSNIQNSSTHMEVLQLKQGERARIENKISTEIEHMLIAIVGWIKVILKREQEKEDFKPSFCKQNPTKACNEVCNFLKHQVLNGFKGPIDGDNLNHVMTELGIRFHGALIDHLLQYQYNVTGAYQLIQDIHKYKETVQHFKVPLIEQLFDAMNDLCQLLIIEPDKIKMLWNEVSLSKIEHPFLVQFVRLRADYRAKNIQAYLPAYGDYIPP